MSGFRFWKEVSAFPVQAAKKRRTDNDTRSGTALFRFIPRSPLQIIHNKMKYILNLLFTQLFVNIFRGTEQAAGLEPFINERQYFAIYGIMSFKRMHLESDDCGGCRGTGHMH
jgi:hypothetical protein